MLKTLLVIGSGSFIGGVARFLISRHIQSNLISSFPLGTLMVNILGCFIIGLIYGLTDRSNILNPELKMFLTVGFCGGFTTFSTFTSENISMLKEGDYLYVALYAGLSLFLGLMATYAGNLIPKAL